MNLEVRAATPLDRPAILEIMRSSLGWPADERADALWRWKHELGPYGPSPVWVGTADGAVVAVRAFMRWELTEPGGGVLRAVRAVDTATASEHRGRGWFRRLTLHGLDALADEGVDVVFNTPNDASRPGYLSMGWQEQGRIPGSVRLLRAAAGVRMLRSRVPADLWPLDSDEVRAPHGGLAPEAAFADRDAVEAALAAATPHSEGWGTRVSVDVLRWRYGLPALGYQVVPGPGGIAEGFAVVRARRRGSLREIALLDVVGPPGSRVRLARTAIRFGHADHAVALGTRPGPEWIRIPKSGPRLVARAVAGSVPRAWRLSLGDVELL